MTDEHQQALIDRILSGEQPKLEQMAVEGLLPLAPQDLMAVQVALARGGRPEMRSAAQDALAAQDPARLAEFVGEAAGPEDLAHLAGGGSHPVVMEAILRRRDTPRSLLESLAASLSTNLQEILLLRQDAIVEAPGILDALESNPQLSRYSRRRIAEYREHLLPKQAKASPELETEDPDELTAEEVEEALEAAREVEAKGEVDEDTGLADSQIRSLPIPVRIKLARTANRPLRAILIRDPNPRVAMAVFAGGSLGDQEVEQIAANRSVVSEVLEEIGRRREWVGRYPIMKALIHNPRAPLGMAIRLVPRLAMRDLSLLARDRNVADGVRSMAQRLYRMKQR